MTRQEEWICRDLARTLAFASTAPVGREGLQRLLTDRRRFGQCGIWSNQLIILPSTMQHIAALSSGDSLIGKPPAVRCWFGTYEQ